jgi:hypothetical protein
MLNKYNYSLYNFISLQDQMEKNSMISTFQPLLVETFI